MHNVCLFSIYRLLGDYSTYFPNCLFVYIYRLLGDYSTYFPNVLFVNIIGIQNINKYFPYAIIDYKIIQ